MKKHVGLLAVLKSRCARTQKLSLRPLICKPCSRMHGTCSTMKGPTQVKNSGSGNPSCLYGYLTYNYLANNHCDSKTARNRLRLSYLVFRICNPHTK